MELYGRCNAFFATTIQPIPGFADIEDLALIHQVQQ